MTTRTDTEQVHPYYDAPALTAEDAERAGGGDHYMQGLSEQRIGGQVYVLGTDLLLSVHPGYVGPARNERAVFITALNGAYEPIATLAVLPKNADTDTITNAVAVAERTAVRLYPNYLLAGGRES